VRVGAILLASFLVLMACAPQAWSSVAAARAELRALIEDVAGASGSRHGLTDDLGAEMDGLKVIDVPEAGTHAGVYHFWVDHVQRFQVGLATSDDLLTWTRRTVLGEFASMPTIRATLDGGYVVAWEEDPEPNHLRFAYFPSWDALVANQPGRGFVAPNTLSDCAEGTPNLYDASRTALDVGFHYYSDCEVDIQARGRGDWNNWEAHALPALDEVFREQGVAGAVGDRDVVEWGGVRFTLIETQRVNYDWTTWRVYLYDEATGSAEELDIRTAAGSTAFTNPTAALVEVEGRAALVVTLFVPQEGARGAEAGSLLYYQLLDED
jgi:hypothetical protein